MEGTPPDSCDSIRNGNARQVGAFKKGRVTNGLEVITNNCDARQSGAVREGTITDAGDTLRDRDALQAGAVLEGVSTDTGDTLRYRDESHES